MTTPDRDLAIARLAQALDVPAHLLTLGEPTNYSGAQLWGVLELSAADIRYRLRMTPAEPLTAYVPQWYLEGLGEEGRAWCEWAGITLRIDGDEACYTVPCPSF
jgi:hypothetical protein